MVKRSIKLVALCVLFLSCGSSRAASIEASGAIFTDISLYALENPILSTMILPDTSFTLKGQVLEMSVSATPGEYESVSVVIRAHKDIQGLTVVVTDLKKQGDGAVIPAREIDVKSVKVWYQGRYRWVNMGHSHTPTGHITDVQQLTPELLLNDDTVVKVDTQARKNYLKLRFPDGDKYVWSNDPREPAIPTERLVGIRRVMSIADYPVRDAKQLLPLDLPANTNKQYWITLHVPEAAQPGFYTGRIRILRGTTELGGIGLRLRVLPFKLPAPKTYYDLKEPFISSIYYRGQLHRDYPQGSISSEYKSKQQLKAELHNMWIHNLTNPSVYQWNDRDDTLLRSYLRIRNKVGMKGPLFNLGLITAPGGGYNDRAMKKLMAMAREFGIKDVYIYGADEAGGDRIRAQRDIWRALHALGAKVFVAGKNKNFDDASRGLLDILVQARQMSTAMAAKWHAAGNKIFLYDNPMTAIENPRVYRKNHGLLPWKAHFDGVMNYAYQDSQGNCYNDNDTTGLRELSLAYPTVDGVISTLAMEGLREGIDDIRYGTLLKTLIVQAKAKGGAKAVTAARAEKFLEGLNPAADGPYWSPKPISDFGAIRLEMIEWILKLSAGSE